MGSCLKRTNFISDDIKRNISEKKIKSTRKDSLPSSEKVSTSKVSERDEEQIFPSGTTDMAANCTLNLKQTLSDLHANSVMTITSANRLWELNASATMESASGQWTKSAVQKALAIFNNQLALWAKIEYFACISHDTEQQIPVWGGGTFNFVKVKNENVNWSQHKKNSKWSQTTSPSKLEFQAWLTRKLGLTTRLTPSHILNTSTQSGGRINPSPFSSGALLT